MQSVRKPLNRQPAIGAPLALLMVVLLAVAHPALRWTCYIVMPWETPTATRQGIVEHAVEHASDSHHSQPAEAPHTHCNDDEDAAPNALCPTPGQHSHHDGDHDVPCCKESQDTSYFVRVASLRLVPKTSSWDNVFPTVAVISPLAPLVPPNVIRNAARDGTTPPPPFLFLSSSPGRAPPVSG